MLTVKSGLGSSFD
jgi:hypothetical protein